jgi:hypothetical protein
VNLYALRRRRGKQEHHAVEDCARIRVFEPHLAWVFFRSGVAPCRLKEPVQFLIVNTRGLHLRAKGPEDFIKLARTTEVPAQKV